MSLESATSTEGLSTESAESKTLPAWYPDWAREMADLYFSGTTCLFVLHGNTHDLIYCPDGDEQRYCSLPDFLGINLFGSWDVVLRYDLGHGMRPLVGSDRQRLQEMMQLLAGQIGEPRGWPRDADGVLLALDQLIERNLLAQKSSQRNSIGLVFEYAQYLLPATDTASLAGRHGARLVRFMEWSQNPYVKRVNTAFCLIADKLFELNDRLVQSPHVACIEIPMPTHDQRLQFVQWATQSDQLADLAEFSAQQLAGLSNGLSLTSINMVLSRARRSGRKVGAERFRKLKKVAIERQCQGLLEFVEPEHTLELVVGHETAKQRLRQDAKFIGSGRLDAAPMGYLLCGPVGTGKTFLAECYAGSIGIPCVKLKNFRSKYVGESEGNLQQVLSVLRSLGPVVVIIDEADAALGNRQSDGDSGTSSRIFSMIAGQMGNTKYRGKIVWMLLTCRPDLLPIDLKRQGRAEVHIPLFYPQQAEEVREMFAVMARKNNTPLPEDALPSMEADGSLSGADIEAVVLSAKRLALAEGRAEVNQGDVQTAVDSFIPSAQGLEKEMQEIAAVLECTQLEFLPQRWRQVVKQPDGRSQLQNRLVSLRGLID